jgi:hypothetical protein
MDFIDNLIYATHASPLEPVVKATIPVDPRIRSYFISPFTPPLAGPTNIGSTNAPVYSYALNTKMDFCSYEDPIAIDRTLLRHWYDVNNQANYDSGGVTQFNGAVNGVRYTSFSKVSTYHLIFAYLTENIRMLQIFERLIDKYLTDEELGIAADSHVFNWIHNSEKLFFANDSLKTIRSLIRPNADATRRNAYWRMFGMDLAFGDINSPNNGSIPYVKARVANQQFVALFEKYLGEVWQSYINANNSSGINSSDISAVVDLALQLRELLMARRGDTGMNSYANLNLSREEFYSVFITSWFTFIISDDTPVVKFLNCQSSTIGERLQKIGNKVGIPAHSKCQPLFEMAGAASNVLSTIEMGGVLDNSQIMTNVLRSLIPPVSPVATPQMNLMNDLLTVINNWERATGHKIKTPAASISAAMKVTQNGTRVQPVLN